MSFKAKFHLHTIIFEGYVSLSLRENIDSGLEPPNNNSYWSWGKLYAHQIRILVFTEVIFVLLGA